MASVGLVVSHMGNKSKGMLLTEIQVHKRLLANTLMESIETNVNVNHPVFRI